MFSRARYILCLIAIIGVFPFVTLGEETSTTSTATNTPAVAPQAPSTPADDVAAARKRERIIELRGRFADGTKYRIKNLLDNVKNRMSATVDRFERISARIETRMKKLEAAGVDTKQARVSLENAQAEIQTARELLVRTTDQDIDNVVDDASPHERFTTLRSRVSEIHTHLQNAHDALSLTVAILKTSSTQTDSAGISTTTTASTTSKK